MSTLSPPHSSSTVIITNRDKDWKEFLEKVCKKQLKDISREYPFKKSLYVNYRDLEAYGVTGLTLADELLDNPKKALTDAIESIISNHLVSSPKNKHLTNLNVRFTNLPRKILIRDIREEHRGEFISVEGIIRKVTEVRPRLTTAIYRCPAGHTTKVKQGYGPLVEPEKCCIEGCNYKGRSLELNLNASEAHDAQKVRIQESPEGMRNGQPQSIDVDITDDLCGFLNPGDHVIINGILKTLQRSVSGVKSSTLDLYIEANSIEKSEKDYDDLTITAEEEESIKEIAKSPDAVQKIARSIAPSIWGMDEVKQAIVYMLFGGVAKELDEGNRLRGDIHILLLGDPGIAKSQLLKYVTKISPRGIFASGKSSSAAGLTATAVKDDFDGRWTLEAGALVLADMGIACVDEMDKMDKNDRSSLHEAMEQQQISVAKAGITATLKSRCALLGAANPKYGRFDDYEDIGEQINMPPSLLSRFDLLFVLRDVPDKTRDLQIAEHMLNTHIRGQQAMKQEKGRRKSQIAEPCDYLDPAIIRKYVAYAKKNCVPAIGKEAKKIILDYYTGVRGLSAGGKKPVPITARYCDALVRLSEASAKIRLSDEITVEDTNRAVKLLDSCLKSVAYDPNTGTWDIDVIATGTSKQTKDLTIAIEQTLKQIISGSDSKQADEKTVLERLTSQNFEEEKVQKRIDAMVSAGSLYRPRDGKLAIPGRG